MVAVPPVSATCAELPVPPAKVPWLAMKRTVPLPGFPSPSVAFAVSVTFDEAVLASVAAEEVSRSEPGELEPHAAKSSAAAGRDNLK